MEQQNGAPGSATAQAARTVLPGEPFDPPMSSQVPGPRPPEQMQAPAPVAQWNYQPAQPAYGQSYEGAPVPGMTFIDPPMAAPMAPMAPMTAGGPAPAGYPADGGDFAALHEYASLPVAQQYGAPGAPTQAYPPQAYPQGAYPQPTPESTWPPAASMQQGFGAQYQPGQQPQQYSPMQAPVGDHLPPLPPPPLDDEPLSDSGHRRSRKSVDKRLLALVGVVVIGGGGYFAYNQFGKSSSDTTASTPVPAAAAPVVAKYDFPAKVDGLSLKTGPAATAARTKELAIVKAKFPSFAKTLSFATYATGKPGVTAFTLHPGKARLAASYNTLVAQMAVPQKGNATVAYHFAQPGAAGGVMKCGGQRGANPLAYCVFKGATNIGALVVTGSPESGYAEIYTREMRAFAEH